MVDFHRIKATQVMRREVATLLSDDPIEEALGLFEELRISGAPVVDSGGLLIGVLTLSDIGRLEHVNAGRITSQRGDFEMVEPPDEERGDDEDFDAAIHLKEDYSAETLGRERVGDWMTREVVTVEPTASLYDVCNVMAGHGIHRVFVTEGQALVGVVSSFDVVRWLARRATVAAVAHA